MLLQTKLWGWPTNTEHSVTHKTAWWSSGIGTVEVNRLGQRFVEDFREIKVIDRIPLVMFGDVHLIVWLGIFDVPEVCLYETISLSGGLNKF